MKQFIADPGSIITIFGTSAPQTAIFFMTYLVCGVSVGDLGGCLVVVWWLFLCWGRCFFTVKASFVSHLGRLAGVVSWDMGKGSKHHLDVPEPISASPHQPTLPPTSTHQHPPTLLLSPRSCLKRC